MGVDIDESYVANWEESSSLAVEYRGSEVFDILESHIRYWNISLPLIDLEFYWQVVFSFLLQDLYIFQKYVWIKWIYKFLSVGKEIIYFNFI